MDEIKKSIIELNEKIDTLQQQILDIEDMLVDLYGISEFISSSITERRYHRKFYKIVDKKAMALEKPIVDLPQMPVLIKYKNKEILEINEAKTELYLDDEYVWHVSLSIIGKAVRMVENIDCQLLFNLYEYENGIEKFAFTKESISFNIYKNIINEGQHIYKTGNLCTCDPGEKIRIEIIDNISPEIEEEKEDAANDIEAQNDYYNLPAYARIDIEREKTANEENSFINSPEHERLKKLVDDWNN